MFGINEILNKIVNKKQLTIEDKFKILNSKKINSLLLLYRLLKVSYKNT